MATNLNQGDILFLLQQVIFGSTPPPGTDPLSLLGLRSTDGAFNNLTNVTIFDQYGIQVDTSTFGTVDQPFFSIVPTQSPFSYDPGFDYANGATETALGLTPDPAHNGDASPRIISNLVADMSVNNPSVPADAIGNSGAPAFFIAPTNSLFTFFGQFFDHGLDFINKGGSGLIEIPLLPGDPHYGLTPVNSMFIDRATLTGGEATNSTAPLVEQSQTYGSRESTTFYLREYDANGEPTGRLVTHADGGMATWEDIKNNALNKGIILEDHHVLDIPDAAAWGSANPLLFDPAANGGLGGFLPAAGTGQAFLADIAHTANPAGGLAPDADAILGNTPGPGFYDDELLAAHKVAGDARVNENVALTAIHSAFHGEHNRIVQELQSLIAQRDQTTPGFAAQWDGERLFQAAKLVNEMQYQHFVFEEFARRLSPNVDAFAQYDITINPNISAEFSQAIYRLGHSMLTEVVRSVNSAGQVDDVSLVTAFLNPVLFDATGAGELVEGQTRQQMNQIDEFVTDALRNFLVGLPLDLAAINIARGRDVGLPTLNQTRSHLFTATGEGTLAPYTSWADFGAHLLHPGSLVNFIAAYAQDAAIAAARNAGNNDLARQLAEAAMSNNVFMGAGGDQGFNNIDLWIGGLAEMKAVGPIGQPGMLGTTFDFIFSTQLRYLQDGDRFYYLARLAGTNILDQIEFSKFGELFERGTGARHTNGDIFATADEYVELSDLGLADFTSTAGNWMEVIGGTTAANTINAGDGNDTVWGEAGNDTIDGGAANDHLFGGAGDDLIHGGSGNDFIRGDAGNDSLVGDVGDDLMFGGTGDDFMHGGQGIDELFGSLGNDELHGGDQDDSLLGQENDDILEGGLGNDALDGGPGDDHLSGGNGSDALLGGDGNDVLVGGAGADLLDGGLGFYDLVTYADSPIGLTIDMANPAASTGNASGDTFIDIEEVRGTALNDQIRGDFVDNVLSGGGGSDTLDGRDGNDTLYSNEGGTDNLIGGLGVDMAVYLGHNFADYIINVSTVGDGTVQENFVGGSAIDTLSGIEQLAFDDGLWSTTTQEFVPLVSVTNSQTLAINGVELDGNLVNLVTLNDNTDIPLNGILLGTIDIVDPDGINGVRAVTLTGADAASFRIVNTAGVQQLRYIGGRDLGLAKANFEVTPILYVTVNVADNSGGSAINYALRLTDVNDNRPVFTSPDSVSAQEGTAADQVIYRATADDLDTVGPQLVYSIVGGADAGRFTMTDGEITFNAVPDFAAPVDSGGDNVYDIIIGASDGVGPVTNKAITIRVTDTGTPPVFTTVPAAPLPVAENTLAATILYDADATDPDGTATTFSLTGTDAALFNIDPVTGVLRFNATPDFENPLDANGDSSYEITIVAFDGFASTLQQVTIVVSNVVGNTINGTAGNDNVNAVQTVPGELMRTNEEDTILGNDGADRLYGGSGNDTIVGGLVADVLFGERGDDLIQGGDGNDYLLGGLGDDVIEGDNNDDKLVGGLGDDSLSGGAGSDRLYGVSEDGIDAEGADILDGGLGDDRLYADSSDTVQGGDGFDVLFAQGTTGLNLDVAAANIEEALGGDFGDVFDGSAEAIDVLRLFGNGGNDVLIGGALGDVINGGQHEDHLIGNGGADWLVGGDDNDLLEGGSGNDLLEGGNGLDVLAGNAGFDRLLGGAGADHFSAAGFDGVTDRIEDYSFADGDTIEGVSFTFDGIDTLVWDGLAGTGNTLFRVQSYDANLSGITLVA